MSDLFKQSSHKHQPLPERLRPKSLAEFVGQSHLLAEQKPLREVIDSGLLHSMIFWGPPGVGKTTLANIIGLQTGHPMMKFSAVLAGIKEIKEAIQRAEYAIDKSPILFIDEIHRFNKSQQDALLPFVESGSVILIGATTENPSFEINAALLSRCRVYVLKSLDSDDLVKIINKALEYFKTLTNNTWEITQDALDRLYISADGDGRNLLNILEICYHKCQSLSTQHITLNIINDVIQQDFRRFDKRGDIFYEQISALHKSVRGSSPDGALYWLCRMLEAGCDPLYIARRVIRMASEDIGNADPRGLTLAINAYDAYDRLGSPEGELALAQAVAYLAVAPKSNAVYTAYNKIKQHIQEHPTYPVPMHLRNAPTKLMKDLAYGREYRYDPDQPGGFSQGQSYFPEEMGETQFYFPTENGLESKIKEKLQNIKNIKNISETEGSS